ncbi:hypothetical protein AM493_04915 [Flavobacterium akiainvivens]|uniref:DUF2938 domain-containing protein n=2 Tax=Flavobacterium akiainvivens TaxID=1202724 RepID=A0A0M9VHD1_9FLAO|nr:hypothetical protein AM493_04915 [Flavobacterium akiainvivens]SFQ32156.1 hypothetical protein SAMN05444144_10316 [Flavobacterium akiainvivens]
MPSFLNQKNMKAIDKIIIAGIVGTSFMTLYSYLRSKKEDEEYVEPVMINKLIDNSENLPSISNEDAHPAGWGLHYATGIGFMAVYWLIWKKALARPTRNKILLLGILSGLVGIAVWKMLFSQHDRPPHNYRYGYYRQLLIAHIVFTLFSVTTYKLLDKEN